ncbi:MAG: hypothetical protein Q7U75_03285 [Desulfobacterales bacterium]|nr:hypothetical protein [Desulfobacterales bacterium]
MKLGVVISQTNPELVFNAFRLANFGRKEGEAMEKGKKSPDAPEHLTWKGFPLAGGRPGPGWRAWVVFIAERAVAGNGKNETAYIKRNRS